MNIINSSAKQTTDKLKISDRLAKLTAKETYVILKVHKPGFQRKLPTKIINPTRSEFGRIAKVILERVNLQIKKQFDLNIQWSATFKVIDWFKKIEDKRNCTSIQFHIVVFIPLFTKNWNLLKFIRTFQRGKLILFRTVEYQS